MLTAFFGTGSGPSDGRPRGDFTPSLAIHASASEAQLGHVAAIVDTGFWHSAHLIRGIAGYNHKAPCAVKRAGVADRIGLDRFNQKRFARDPVKRDKGAHRGLPTERRSDTKSDTELRILGIIWDNVGSNLRGKRLW
jgi:hypothetical protein